MSTDTEDRTRLLDAAEALFYAHGVQAVGMDRLRAESGVPLKRLYRVFPAKEALVAAYLERRDERWTTSLRTYVLARPDARERVLAVFDWLGEWFAEPGFRGCAFLNAYGELGTAVPAVTEVVRAHKARLRGFLVELAEGAGGGDGLADRLMVLVEGATVVAGVAPALTAAPAAQAREVAELLLTRTRGAGQDPGGAARGALT
ncbi:TetR/AcrR family transcriptional regulator [Streptomyces sp. NPDC101118]|uniref:TetR/AcrR family transcriptional regulator n=1 Tax=Streptomyces sp. NPDC101118 TaxID=3366109 RepID=UPI00381B8990